MQTNAAKTVMTGAREQTIFEVAGFGPYKDGISYAVIARTSNDLMAKLRIRYANTICTVFCPYAENTVLAVFGLNHVKTVIKILAPDKTVASTVVAALHLSSLVWELNFEFLEVIKKTPDINAAVKEPLSEFVDLFESRRLVENMILLSP
ncbi:hypothetical protein COW94_04825 [Candidatus Peregrinibacteria bacterium CG22_combo_CG10-13_8_21_14_all_44_10]|nr:MAG: hypothetical protein AUK45_01020 [Candidatus Peregrinibacteria bacterium CG2_30_44_17]PIP65857.1 MAG: hypothetical protein COW94_04825 [Candidatus Peregrinibacteria bacterium CG22_combo_CG10-13_8_21_14_all_44_10]PIS03593.1 MAG: hypothetical protein COT83_05265 [Candidatus Peregrinibacteria bacterium CG10_big_fil_rev_8_21_14_0_10_44_7]PIX80612.1 MAG: hypothetical protein COZ35_00215 [Candidatus Peregrinibacteria bacterium CG_4_10_14_3_um_filter_44_21]PJB88604.1 MAG: hypothetical protein 